MATKIARKGDRTTGVCVDHGAQGGTITSGAVTVFAETKEVARLGDTVLADCGDTAVITSASATIFAESTKVARVGDTVAGAKYTGSISTGATTVEAG